MEQVLESAARLWKSCGRQDRQREKQWTIRKERKL